MKKKSKKSSRRSLITQFLKYMVGGGLYFWSGYAVFALCYSVLKWDWLWAKMAADAVGWTLNFLVQRFWAFNHPQLGGHAVKITGRYIVITAINFLLDYAIVYGLKQAGVTPYLGLFISSFFFTVWNFLWYRLWVFNTKPTAKVRRR